MPALLESEPPALEFRLLGGCDIRVHGRPLPPPRYRKEWWLLALLVLRHDRESSRDALAEAFWPDSDGDRALLYLRRSLTNLRHALGPEAARLLSPSPRTLRFDLSGAFADAAAFDRAVRKTPSHSPSEEELAQAVELYQGPLLPDCTEEWVLPEREERAQAYLAALEDLAQKATDRSDPAAAVHWLRRLVFAAPRRESASGALMMALAEGGDRAAATQVYQDLRRLLRQELNTEPAPETRALHRRLTEQEALPPAAAPSPAPLALTLRHLPIPLTDLIGRTQEIEEVTGWLRRGRLVTLLGTGGVGKTRLAIAAAEAALPQFAAGVWFVDLAPLSAPSLVPEAVAKALGISDEAGRSAEEWLAEALAASSLLLVLDNCEHVLDACAALSSHLLSACPHLRVLTTSRQVLGVPGEQAYAVPSLRLPPQERLGPEADPAYAEKNVLALLEYGSVRLFTERATQTSPSFRLTRRNAESVVEICHRLDGIPLALELAAARVRSLSPQEICARLEDRFRLLVVGNRAAAPRHQTLRAVIDWSYGLLSVPERSLLHRLSVFAGGWRLESAEAVCAGSSGEGVLEPWEVLALLTGLTEKSLAFAEMTRVGTDGVTRYRLQETVRQYARTRLVECGEEEAVRGRHRDEFLHLAERANPEMQGPGQTAWLDRLEEEHDNLRASLAWEEQSAAGAEAGLRLAGSLCWFWSVRGHLSEGRQWLGRALARTEVGAARPDGVMGGEATAARGKALNGAGRLACNQGDYAVAQALLEESLTLYRQLGNQTGIAASLGSLGVVALNQDDYAVARALYEESLIIQRRLGDQTGIANSLNSLGVVAWNQGDYAAARVLLEESLTIQRQLGYQTGIANSLNSLGVVALNQDDYAVARALHEESLTIRRQLGDQAGIANSLNNLGVVASDQDDYAVAQALLEESLILYRQLGNQGNIANSLGNLGVVALNQGDYAVARAMYEESLTIRRQLGNQNGISYSLESLAEAAHRQGQSERAARLGGAASALRESIGSPLNPADQKRFDKTTASAAEALGEAAFAAAWEVGRAMTLEQAVEYGLSDGGRSGGRRPSYHGGFVSS